MKTSSFFFITAALLLSLLTINDPAYAAGKIRTVYTTWFPYTYQDNQGKAMGFENEIFRAVMKKLDYDVEFIRRPWKRCLYMLQTGKADALVSLLKSKERESYTVYSDENISISRTLLFTRIDSPIQYDGSLENLRPYTIGTTRGFSYGKAFDDAFFLKKEAVNDQTAIIRKVLYGRNDLGIGNQLVIITLALQLGKQDSIRFLEPPIHTNRLYVGFSRARKHRRLSNIFSNALVQFKRTAEYQGILTRYNISIKDMSIN